jgi:dihydroneopterin aldolase
MQRIITLTGMRFHGKHGVHAEEALTGQWFEIDLDVCLRDMPVDTGDMLSSTLDYEGLYRMCQEVMDNRAQLLETLAARLHDRLRDTYPECGSVRIRVSKMHPPFPGNCRQVSYTLIDEGYPHAANVDDGQMHSEKL